MSGLQQKCAQRVISGGTFHGAPDVLKIYTVTTHWQDNLDIVKQSLEATLATPRKSPSVAIDLVANEELKRRVSAQLTPPLTDQYVLTCGETIGVPEGSSTAAICGNRNGVLVDMRGINVEVPRDSVVHF